MALYTSISWRSSVFSDIFLIILTKTGVIFAGGIRMEKITILGDPTVNNRAQNTHAGKIDDGDQGIAHRQAKTHAAKSFESTEQSSVRFDQMKLAGSGLFRQLRVYLCRIGQLLKIDRFKHVKKVHCFQLIEAMTTKPTIAVINDLAPWGGTMIKSFLLDPADHLPGIDEQQKLWRKKKKENGRDIQCQDQHNMKNKPKINRRDACLGTEKQKDKNGLANQDRHPDRITQRGALAQKITQQKIFCNSRSRVMHQAVNRIAADPVPFHGNLIQGRVEIREPNLQLQESLDKVRPLAGIRGNVPSPQTIHGKIITVIRR